MNRPVTEVSIPQVALRTPRITRAVTLLCLVGTAGCGALTRQEAQEALEEVKVDSQALTLTSESVELSTNFTIGKAVEEAAGELRTFVETQLPCAESSLSFDDEQGIATLSIEYGAKSGNCSYRGHTWSGRHIVSVAKNGDDLVQVDHVWEALSNGKFSVDGSASVEWDRENKTRHVVHDATWTRLSDGRTGEGSGDRLQRALDGGLAEGFGVDGERHWRGKKGDWDLEIDGVEIRWIDPVPQAGTYTLDTPFGKRIEASFERVSATSIQVVLAGPKRSFDFKVTTLPGGDERTEEMQSAADGEDE